MFDLIILVGLVVAFLALVYFMVKRVRANVKLGNRLRRLEEQDDLEDLQVAKDVDRSDHLVP